MLSHTCSKNTEAGESKTMVSEHKPSFEEKDSFKDKIGDKADSG